MTKPWSEIKHKSAKTYYVSGPMRGIPSYNFPLFDSMSAWLRREGFGAINPADHDREVEPDVESTEHYKHGDPLLKVHGDGSFRPTFHDLIGWDLRVIASPECDGIVMLPGWEKSTGAAHERYVAEACGKEVWLAHPVWTHGHHEHGEWYMTLDEDRTLTSETAAALRERLSRRDGEPREAWAQDIEHVRQGSPFTMPHADPLGIQAGGSAQALIPSWQYPSARRPVSFALPDGMNEQVPHWLNTPEVEEIVHIGQFQTKDSGARVEFESGMVRDVQDDKPRYDLIPLAPLKRLAELYARGAQKYGDRNWQKANSQEELERFKASGFRHFIQFLMGDRDEDHAIGAVWNLFAALWLEERLCQVPSVMENDK